MSSTTVRSVHYTCDPYSVFLAWHGDSSPPKVRPVVGQDEQAFGSQPCLISRPSCGAPGTLGIGGLAG